MTYRETLESMFFDSTRPMRFVMMWSYIFACAGICIRASDASGDMALMFDVAPLWVWASVCTTLAGARFIGIFHRDYVTYFTRRTAPVMGIFMWSALFAAGIAVEPRGMALLYLICAAIEVWFLARAFASKLIGD